MKTMTPGEVKAESGYLWNKLWENAWPFIHDENRSQIDGTYYANGILHIGDPAFRGIPDEAWTTVDFNKLVNRFWRVEQQRAPIGKNPSTTWLGDQSRVELDMIFIIQLTKEMPSQAYGTDPGSVNVGDFGYLQWQVKDRNRAMSILDWWMPADQMQNVQWLDGSTLNLIRETDEWVSMGVISTRREDGVRVVLPEATRFLYLLARLQSLFFPFFSQDGYIIKQQLMDKSRMEAQGWLIEVDAKSDELQLEYESFFENPDGAFYLRKRSHQDHFWVAYMGSMGSHYSLGPAPRPNVILDLRNNPIKVVKRDGEEVVAQPLTRLEEILQNGFNRMLSELEVNMSPSRALTRCLINRRA